MRRMVRLSRPAIGPRAVPVGLHWLLACGVLLVGGPMAWAVQATEQSSLVASQSSPVRPVGEQVLDETLFPGLATRMSLDLRGMDVVEVLKFLATKGGLNIVAGSDVQGRVTLTLTEVAVRDALDIVLVSNGLALERRGTILYIMSGKMYEELYGHRYGDPRQSLIVQLKYANPGQAGALLGNIKSAVGRIVIDEPTATVAMLDTPTVLEQMQTLIARVDIPTIQRQLPTVTKAIPLQFAKAEDVKSEVDSAVTPDVGHVRLDKRSNTLIVTEMPAKLPQLEELIKAFDARHRQVYLEATVLQITLKDQFDTGIEWQWFSESKHFPNVTVLQSLPISSAATNALKLTIGAVKPNDVTATIKALHTFGKTKTLSNPMLSVMNNQEAKILVGRREAYVTSTVTQAQATATTAESVQFVDVGVKLYVTPTINDTGFITMKIRPEVSSKVDKLETKTTTVPIIETSEAETTVMVKDGVTLVIGGLMKDEVTKNEQKIPLLGDLPVLGVLFRNNSDQVQKTELVILITPHIISGEESVRPATAAVDRSTASR